MSVKRVRELSTALIAALDGGDHVDTVIVAFLDAAVRLMRAHRPDLDAVSALREISRTADRIAIAETAGDVAPFGD